MSWLFSRALVEEYSRENYWDGEPSAPSNGSPTPQAYCAPDKMTDFSRLSRFGMTFKPSTDYRGEELLTLYLEDFHAKTSARQEKVTDLTENDQECGNTWRGWLAKYDPDSCSWKTPQCSLLGEEPESLATLPRWGMTVDGLLWEQPMLEPITSGTEYGLWASPNARDWKDSGASQGNRKSPNLVTQVHYPTPTMQGLNGGSNGRKAFQNRQMNWPTPRTAGMCGGTGSWELLNKNTTKEEARQMGAGNGGKLNPDWVEWLMNWPIKWSDLNGFDKKEFQRWQETSAAALQGRKLPTMWWDADPSQTSLGQQPVKQSEKQHSNSLSKVSRDITRQSEMERSFQGSDLSVLRDDIHLQKTERENLQQGMREQTCMDETQIVPRTSQTVTARVDRLKAIGNGQVPLCAATAFQFLSGAFK